MAEIKYVVKLTPVTKKNSGQIVHSKKTGRPFLLPSAKYRQYEKEAVWFLRPKPPKPIECAVNVKCLFYLPTRRRTDLNNLLEAVTDLLVTAGILADDHYGIVQSHDGSRCFVDRDNPRTEIYITKVPADEQMEMDGV